MNSSMAYYSSCDYDLIGDCNSCVTNHIGNWWSELDQDDYETCCTPSPYLRGKRFLYSYNKTTDCPQSIVLSAGTGFIVEAGLVTVSALGYVAWCAYRCVRKWMRARAERAARLREPTVAWNAAGSSAWIEMGVMGSSLSVVEEEEEEEVECGGDDGSFESISLSTFRYNDEAEGKYDGEKVMETEM